MLASILFRRVAYFSRLYHQSAVLDYPLNHHDEGLLKNKTLMDEVNNNFVNILKKVRLLVFRPRFKQTKKYWINFTSPESYLFERGYKNC